MTPEDLKLKISIIAKAVQTWSRAYVQDLLDKDSSYDFDPKSMDCMCAYTSTVLLECLHWQGIENAVLHSNDYHVFICHDEYMVDITACQFSDKFEPIEIGVLADFLKKDIVLKYCEGYWDKKYTYSTAAQAYEGLHNSSPVGFPSSQFFRKKQELMDAINSAKCYIKHACDTQNML